MAKCTDRAICNKGALDEHRTMFVRRFELSTSVYVWRQNEVVDKTQVLTSPRNESILHSFVLKWRLCRE